MKYIKIVKLTHTVTKELSKYKFNSYMNDFPEGTAEAYTKLTGKKVTKKEINAWVKKQKPVETESNESESIEPENKDKIENGATVE